MDDEELAFLFTLQEHCFSALPVLREKISKCGSVRQVWHAVTARGGVDSSCLTQRQASLLLGFSVKKFVESWLRWQRQGVKAITFLDPLYPVSLFHIAQPPLVLFCRGDLSLLCAKPILAVVGTRKMTGYGRQVLEHFIPQFVEAGFVIVSGLAMGVDSLAHQLTVNHGGKTVAVQAQGIDQGYPARNRHVFEEVLRTGLVVSEYLEEPVPVRNSHFPRRNRIISALGEEVLIIEAGEKSGSLITAGFAMDEGKTVCAVPGDVLSPGSVGCHALIKSGAKPFTCMQDILEDFSPQFSKKITLPVEFSFSSILEEEIFKLCRERSRTLEDLVDSLQRPVSELLSALTLMELKGMLLDIDGLKKVV